MVPAILVSQAARAPAVCLRGGGLRVGSYLLASAEEAWYNYVYQAAGSLELYSGTSRVSECVCVCVCVRAHLCIVHARLVGGGVPVRANKMPAALASHIGACVCVSV